MNETDFIIDVFVIFLIAGFLGRSAITRWQQIKLTYFFAGPGILLAIPVLRRVPDWKGLWIIPVILLLAVLGQLIPLLISLLVPKRFKEKMTEEERRLGYGLTGAALIILCLGYQLAGVVGSAVGLAAIGMGGGVLLYGVYWKSRKEKERCKEQKSG